MAATELSEKLTGPRREEYRGVETVAVYSDVRQEFRALIEDVGAYDLNWRAKLLVSGRDRVRWLNGMITNNVRDLPAGQGVYSFLLTPQGRILGDLYVYNRGEGIIIDTDQSQAENLVASLRKYIIMDQVEISSASDPTGIGFTGPKSPEGIRELGIQLPELRPLQTVVTSWHDVEVTVIRGDVPSVESYEIWLHPAHAGQLWQAAVDTGIMPVGSNAVELLRIACGVPRYGQDIGERDLPQETEQMRALSFTKGCYIGQEIVERIRSRGAVHRKFSGFLIDGPLPAPGAKAQADGKDIAEITSSGFLPTGGSEFAVALGYVRREVGIPGKQIEIAGAKATVADLPFPAIFRSAEVS